MTLILLLKSFSLIYRLILLEIFINRFWIHNRIIFLSLKLTYIQIQDKRFFCTVFTVQENLSNVIIFSSCSSFFNNFFKNNLFVSWIRIFASLFLYWFWHLEAASIFLSNIFTLKPENRIEIMTRSVGVFHFKRKLVIPSQAPIWWWWY